MKLIILISAFVIFTNLNGQKDEFFISKWRVNQPDYTTPDSTEYYAAKKNIAFYCISNNDSNLYVDAKVSESIEKSKVLQIGMTVWINMDGKSKKITGIRFPIGAKYSGGQGSRGGANNKSNQPSPLALANMIELSGFTDVERRRFLSDNPKDIRGHVKYSNNGDLLISLIIPFSKLPSTDKKSDNTRQLLTIGIEYGAPPKMPEMTGSGYGPPSGGGSGSGGRPGGGSGGGSGRGGPPPGGGSGGYSGEENLPKPTIIWIENIKLAEKQ